MQEKIDIKTLNKHYDKIKEMLGSFILMYNKDYDFICIGNEFKTFFIDTSITYAFSIISDEYPVNSFDDCVVSKEINEKKPYIIPDAFRSKILQLINDIIDDFKNIEGKSIFKIEANRHLGRMDLLWKSIMFQIKLLGNRQLDFHQKLPENIKPFLKPIEVSLQKEVHLYYDTLVTQAIHFSLCYENNPKNLKMCREILLQDVSNAKHYPYRLEKNINRIIKKM